jgi:putative PIN family toxin of toxin-antitoxin system
MKAVLDANVLIAAYLTEGLCARLLRRARQRQYELVTCPAILTETRQHKKLTSPRPDFLAATLQHLQAIATLVIPDATLTPEVCRDPADNVVLGCALTAGVDYLVTGDHDLLDLRPFRGISIVRPREFESLFPSAR